jgi:tRNA U34 5-methylaminomethyl-2-thiouridine-forming methyltransferase MnmC
MESRHIFINLGLLPAFEHKKDPISVFEMGFGTGLNALLTWKIATEQNRKVEYTSIEAYPIPTELAELLNYEKEVQQEGLLSLHELASSQQQVMSPHFTFQKELVFLQEYVPSRLFDVIYFDAFSPEAQPELWTEDIFKAMYTMLVPNGILVTYSSKGVVRRALQSAGFTVEKHPGPGYKREVVRALKKI